MVTTTCLVCLMCLLCCQKSILEAVNIVCEKNEIAHYEKTIVDTLIQEEYKRYKQLFEDVGGKEDDIRLQGDRKTNYSGQSHRRRLESIEGTASRRKT